MVRRRLLIVLCALGCGGGPAPAEPMTAPPPRPRAVASAPPAEPPLVDGWREVRREAYAIRLRPRSHAEARLDAATALVEAELGRIRQVMALSSSEGNGVVVYLHDAEEKGGPSKVRAFASWRDDGEVSAHFLFVPDFDDRTELLRSLVANELVKATTFAALRRAPDDHMDKPSSALAWLMEGSGTLLHTGGWFGRDVDALATAFLQTGVDYPIPTILASDYQKAWTFNPRTTHTFNLIEFPQMASFTRYLWQAYTPQRFTALLRLVRERGDAGALQAFEAVYGTGLEELERRWRESLKDGAKADPRIDAPRFARVLRRYVAVLEVSARGITFDNAAAASWRKRLGGDISVKPLLAHDLEASEAALGRAEQHLIADLEGAAALVEKGLKVTISLPMRKVGKGMELTAGPATVRAVAPGGLGAERGLQKGDEVHLLDSELYAARESAPKTPYTGVLRVTREGSGDVVLAP